MNINVYITFLLGIILITLFHIYNFTADTLVVVKFINVIKTVKMEAEIRFKIR
jgi:hypothetical protein